MQSFPPVEEESHIPSEEVIRQAPPRATPKSKPVVTAPEREFKPNPLPAAAMMLVLGGALVGGGILVGKTLTGEPAAAPAAPASPPSGTAAAETPPAKPEGPAPATADELKALASKVDALLKSVETTSKNLGALQAKVDALPKPAPAPDLKPIETKIAALDGKVTDLAGKTTTPAAPAVDLKPIESKLDGLSKTTSSFSGQIETLTSRLTAQEKSLAALKTQLAEKPVAATRSGTSEKPATPAASLPSVDVEAALAAAIGLYKQNQFGPARDAFVKLQATAPNDARVWYYAALSNGFATNQWAEGSDTVRFATKGAELEKAGTPDKAKIDAAMTDLRPDAKGWIDSYRTPAR
jgi:peptidoglycan hydrolase CwlO-like protein